jgi:hypothetical protein
MATSNDPVTPLQGVGPTAEPTWDQRILAVLPSSVDLGQLRENLRLTPTERVEQMLALVAFVEAQRERRRVRATSSR